MLELRNRVIEYYKNNEALGVDFPIKREYAEELKRILLKIAFDKNTGEKIDIERINDEKIKRLALIANSKTEDKARFRKWQLDTFTLVTFAEMLNVVSDTEKYYFVRQKIVN